MTDDGETALLFASELNYTDVMAVLVDHARTEVVGPLPSHDDTDVRAPQLGH